MKVTDRTRHELAVRRHVRNPDNGNQLSPEAADLLGRHFMQSLVLGVSLDRFYQMRSGRKHPQRRTA